MADLSAPTADELAETVRSDIADCCEDCIGPCDRDNTVAALSELARRASERDQAERRVDEIIEAARLVEIALAERADRLAAAVDQAAYALNPNQGERADPVLALQWLCTTFPSDHPNYVDPDVLAMFPNAPSSSSAATASQETQEQYPEDGRTRSDYEAFGG